MLFALAILKKGYWLMFPFPLFFKQYATLLTWDFHGVCMYMYLYHIFILQCTWIITPFTLLVCTLLKAIQTCLFLVIQKKNNWICSWCWRFWKKWKIIFFGKIYVNIRIGAIIIILFQIYTSTRYKYFVFGWGPSYLGFIEQSFAYALFFFKQTEGF